MAPVLVQKENYSEKKKCLIFEITAGVIHRCVYGQLISCGDVYMYCEYCTSFLSILNQVRNVVVKVGFSPALFT